MLRNHRISSLLRAAWRVSRNRGLTGLYLEFQKFLSLNVTYDKWIQRHDSLNENDRKEIADHIATFSHHILISIITPTFNTPEKWLRRSIDSVLDQLYPNWELCIADDASTQPHVRMILEEYQRLDKRIKIVFRNRNGHISAASNSALDIATGQFVALLDHDDELPEHALYMVALAIERSPELNLIYSDEDKIDENGRRSDPYFKSDWNPDLLNAQNMISHLGVYRTDLLRSIGGFREGLEGSQDWDLALRVTEQIPPSTIQHIPQVLYHWRTIPGSAAIGPSEKDYVFQASLRVVQDHLQRQACASAAEPAFSSFVRVRHPVPDPAPLVSILLACNTPSIDKLLLYTNYPSLEILTRSDNRPNGDFRLQLVDGGNSLAEWFNLAANAAQGTILCLIDADLIPRNSDWLKELASHALRPQIGAVGPLMLDAKGYILEAQTVLCANPASNTFLCSYYSGFPEGEKGVRGRAALAQNLTVLPPGCLVISAATYKSLGGLNFLEFPDAYYNFDLCLRMIEASYRNMWSPNAQLTKMSTCKSVILSDESQRFRERWTNYIGHDPAHNPNIACGTGWPEPAFPPRKGKPWRNK